MTVPRAISSIGGDYVSPSDLYFLPVGDSNSGMHNSTNQTKSNYIGFTDGVKWACNLRFRDNSFGCIPSGSEMRLILIYLEQLQNYIRLFIPEASTYTFHNYNYWTSTGNGSKGMLWILNKGILLLHLNQFGIKSILAKDVCMLVISQNTLYYE